MLALHSSLGAFGAFYLPMVIMINSYIATVRLLKQKAKFCKEYEWTTHSLPSGNRINIDDMEYEAQKRFSGEYYLINTLVW